MLFTECHKDGGKCVCKRFVDGASEGYGYIVCDYYGVAIFMHECGDVMFPFAMYFFVVVTL